MPIVMKGNYIFTSPGKKAYLASSNYVNYIELGKEGVTEYHLEARIRDDEFVVDGRLYDSDGRLLCILRNNQLEHMKKKCEIILDPKRRGYTVLTEEGDLVLELS